MTETHLYRAYGSLLRSSLPLPELRPDASSMAPRWDFQVVESLRPAEELEHLGEEPIYGDVAASLLRHPAGYRITIPDTGTFDLEWPPRAGGHPARITWRPNAEPWWDFGRSHLLGRVLATALHLDGESVLHGSAVETGEGVVAFLAPKHFGKSTLSRELFRAGARFVTDDSLPVALASDQQPMAGPGIQSLRVRVEGETDPDLLAAVATLEPGRDGKVGLPPVPADRAMLSPRPLAALYLLDPQKPGSTDQAVTRVRVPPVVATALVVGQMKIGAMLGSSFVPSLLKAAAAMTARVPVYRLSVLRDRERLPEVVETLLTWHGLPEAR